MLCLDCSSQSQNELEQADSDSWSPHYEIKMAKWNEESVTTRQILLDYLQFK